MPLTLRKPLLIFIIYLQVIPFILRAQSIAVGPNSPATAINESFTGSDISFAGVPDVYASDNSRATAASLISFFSGQSGYLKTTNYGFSIPLSSVIKGIRVQVEKSGAGIGNILGLESYITDHQVRIVKNGTVTGNNYATTDHWTNSDNYYTYGGSNDLWGTTWLPTDINAAEFGLAFSADIRGLTLLPVARIDHIRITVYYEDIVLPLPLVQFNITPTNNHTVAINWETGSQNKPGIIEVQRSMDGKQWEATPGITGIQTTNHTGFYAVTDNNPLHGKSYYRLKMTTAAGKMSYSESKSITLDLPLQVKVFPNPFTSKLTITGIQPGIAITLFDSYGRKLSMSYTSVSNNTVRLELGGLKPGIYYLAANGKRVKLQKW